MKQYLDFSNKRNRSSSISHDFSTIFNKIESLFFIVLCLIFIILSKFASNFTNKISYIFVDISNPIVRIASFPFNLVINSVVNLEGLVNAHKENKFLREENDKMRAVLLQTLEIENQNQELRDILKFVIPRTTNFKMAQIKTVANGLFNQSMTLESREDTKIKEGSAVVDNYTMIGRAIDVIDNKARLLLPTDANSHIPVIVSNARVRGVLVGDNSATMKISYIESNHNIKEGDLVFTSSDGETLPPGLLIGIVKKVSGNNVSVEMAQDPRRSEIVTIFEY